ncbi:hypothetical protein ACIPV2_00280 [Microbacterium sp. NPDC089987]|uniref:hypothetical protein n=1 Tax=Microbacterium sp. NPDC089987 TaxID=3364202 RepID=UPI003801EEAE
MSSDRLDFRLLYAFGSGTDPMMLAFGGEPEEMARAVITRALVHVGRSDDGDGSDLKLSPADVLGDDPQASDTHFLVLDGNETLADLRLAIGPEDSRVLLRQGSWGDSQGPEYFLWAVNDFLPFARNLLEAYGAVEVMRAAGRAIEKRRHRETRREAEYWVRGGYGEVHGLLRDQVAQYRAWPVADLRSEFGLSDGDAAQLMKVSGYDYDPATKTYYRLDLYGTLDPS